MRSLLAWTSFACEPNIYDVALAGIVEHPLERGIFTNTEERENYYGPSEAVLTLPVELAVGRGRRRGAARSAAVGQQGPARAVQHHGGVREGVEWSHARRQ